MGRSLSVTVVNDLIPPTAVTVRIHSSPGERRLLGELSPTSERTFRFEPQSISGEFRLVAETTAGGMIQSLAFSASPGESVEWLLRTNTINFLE